MILFYVPDRRARKKEYFSLHDCPGGMDCRFPPPRVLFESMGGVRSGSFTVL